MGPCVYKILLLFLYSVSFFHKVITVFKFLLIFLFLIHRHAYTLESKCKWFEGEGRGFVMKAWGSGDPDSAAGCVPGLLRDLRQLAPGAARRVLGSRQDVLGTAWLWAGLGGSALPLTVSGEMQQQPPSPGALSCTWQDHSWCWPGFGQPHLHPTDPPQLLFSWWGTPRDLSQLQWCSSHSPIAFPKAPATLFSSQSSSHCSSQLTSPGNTCVDRGSHRSLSNKVSVIILLLGLVQPAYSLSYIFGVWRYFCKHQYS